MNAPIDIAGGGGDDENDSYMFDDLDTIFSSSTALESLFSEHSPRSPSTNLSAVSPSNTSGSNAATSWKPSPTLGVDAVKEWSDWDEWRDWVEYDWGNNGVTPYNNEFSLPTSDLGLTSSDFDFSCLPPDALLSRLPLHTPQLSADLSTSLSGDGYPITELSTLSQLQSINEEPHLLEQPPSSGNHMLEPEPSLPQTDDQVPRTLPPASSKKRKSASFDPDSLDDRKQHRKPNKRTTHNLVEKRYRNKLNDSIAALRDCVPSLQETDKDIADQNEEDWDSRKSVTKGVVISRATLYIKELDARNKRLSEENMLMQRQLEAFKRLSTKVTQPTGNPTYSNGGALSKLMVGGLAGMLAFQGFTTAEQSNETPSGRGLFALPIHIFDSLTYSFHHFTMLSGTSLGDSAVLLFKVLLIFGAMVYIIWPSYFNAIPKETPSPKAAQLSTAALTNDTSPQDVRRRAFLTAAQTVWIPNKRFELLTAIMLQLARLGARGCGIDWAVFARLSGTPLGQEALAVKAWDIALDAQLTGGDSEVNVGRLFLTLLAAASLPETPYRLMLRAVHARVLSRSAVDSWPRVLRGYLDRLAKSQWEKARTQRAQLTKRSGMQDELPMHLVRLLDLETEKVLLDEVVERAYEMVWNKPRANSISDSIGWMHAITEDSAVRSPLDALAAWCSAVALRNILMDFLEENIEEGSAHMAVIEKDLDLALKIAPPRSTIWIRELVMRTILLGVGQRTHMALVLRALLISSSQPIPAYTSTYPQHTLSSVAKHFISTDLSLPLRSAIAITLLRSSDEQKAMSALAKQIEASGNDIGLLGFVALCRLLDIVFRDKEAMDRNRELVEKIAALLRLWIGGDRAKVNELGKLVEKRVASLCVGVFEWLVGIQDRTNVK